MKQFTIIMLSLSALFSLFFTSCETHDYLNTKTINYYVKMDDWRVGKDDASGDYLYCTFEEPSLTSEVYNNGMIVAYMSFEDGRLSPLPFSDYWGDRYGNKWKEQVTCEIEPGYVTFIFKTDDHILETHYDYNFVLKLAW